MTTAWIFSLIGFVSFPQYCVSSHKFDQLSSIATEAETDSTSFELNKNEPWCELGEEFEEHERISLSDERQMCRAQSHMDKHVFPPEQFSDYAIRMAFPAVPYVGDIFFAVKSLEIVKGSFSLDFRRIDDSTFHFDLYGDGVDGHEKGLAEFGVYLRGVVFYTSSVLGGIVKLSHSTGTLLKKSLTLGLYDVFVDEDRVTLDNIPVSVKTRLSGDIHLTDGGQWKVVPESRSQYAHVALKKKGILWHLYNALIRRVGGMDALLFDRIWPLVELLVPAAMGEAFQQMPSEEGQFSERLQVNMLCAGDAGSLGQACEGNRLKVSVKSTTSMKLDPRPTLNKLRELGYFATTGIVQRMLDSYEKGNSVLKGAHVGLLVDAEVKSNKELRLSASPRMNTPMSLFTSIVGPGVPVANFVPQEGAPLMVGGGLTARDGVVAIKDVRLQGATLPVGTKETDFVRMGFVSGFQVELEDAGGNPSFENHEVFGQTGVERWPLKFDMPSFFTSLGMSSGFALNPVHTNYTVGDGVIVLDATGRWRPGRVVDVTRDGTFVVKSTDRHGDNLEEGTYAVGQMQPMDINYAGTLYGEAHGRAVETDLRLEGGRLVVGGQDQGLARFATNNSANDAVTIKAGDWVLHGEYDERGRLNGDAEKGGISQGKLSGIFTLPGNPVAAVEFGPRFLSDILHDAGMSLPADPINTRDAYAAIDEADGPVPLKFAQPFVKMPPRGLDINEMLRTGTFKVGVEVAPLEDNSKEHIQSTVTVEGELELAMSTHVYSAFIDNLVPDLGYMHYTVGGMLQYGSSQAPCIISLSCGFLRIYRSVMGKPPFGAPVLFSHDLQDGIGQDDWLGPVGYDATGLRSEPKLEEDQVGCIRVGKRSKIWAWHYYYFCAEETSIQELAEAVNTQVKRFKDAKRRSSSCAPGPGGTGPACSHADGTWFKSLDPWDPRTWFPLRGTRGSIKVASPAQEWSEALKAV